MKYSVREEILLYVGEKILSADGSLILEQLYRDGAFVGLNSDRWIG